MSALLQVTGLFVEKVRKSCLSLISSDYDGHMENITFTTHTYTGVPVAALDTETEMTDIHGNTVVVDHFWHNGSLGIFAHGRKYRKDGQLMDRGSSQLIVRPSQAICDALNALAGE